MVNVAFLALSAANPGLLPLALMDSSSSQSSSSSGRRRRLNFQRREEEDRKRQERREWRDARVPADIRGLDPEEDGWLIDEIVAARPLETQLKLARAELRKVKKDPYYATEGLCPEEDGWLIRDILADGTGPYEAEIVRLKGKIAEAKYAAWIESQIESTEGRP